MFQYFETNISALNDYKFPETPNVIKEKITVVTVEKNANYGVKYLQLPLPTGWQAEPLQPPQLLSRFLASLGITLNA